MVQKYVQILLPGFPGGSVGKESACNAGDTGDMCSIPGSGRSPREGHGNPLQYSCLENLMDRGGWWATVHEVAKSRTRLKWLSMTLLPGTWKNDSRFLESFNHKWVLNFVKGFLCIYWDNHMVFIFQFVNVVYYPSMHNFPNLEGSGL